MRKILTIFFAVILLQIGVVSASYAAPPASGGNYHTVRYGETLFSIGRQYGVNPYSIARVNGLRNPDWIYAGQVLYIPSGYGQDGRSGCGWGGYNSNCGWQDYHSRYDGGGCGSGCNQDGYGRGDCGSGCNQNWYGQGNCGSGCNQDGYGRGDCGSGCNQDGYGRGDCSSGCNQDWYGQGNCGSCGQGRSRYDQGYGYDYAGYYYYSYYPYRRYSYTCGYYYNCY